MSETHSLSEESKRKAEPVKAPLGLKIQFAEASVILVATAATATAAAVAAATTATTATATATAETTAFAAEATATAAAAAEAATWTLFLWTGFIDRESAATEIGAVHLLSGELGLIGRAHGNESETAWAAGHLVHGDVEVGHGAKLAEGRAQLVFGGVER
jgi:hypothetical protein